MINQKLISHQVFESIQGGISDSPMRKGTIIFANKFTGEPVEMSEELRLALGHEGTFIGNNPINQLEKAMEGVPGGPWFIDIRNEIVYIHNKALDQPANYEYVYGSENGELLKVSFKTQYRTKNAPRGGTMSIDQFEKTLRVHSNSQTATTEIVGDETDKTAKDVLINRAREAYLEAKVSTMYPQENKGGGVKYTKSDSNVGNFLSYVNTGLRRRGKASLGNDPNKLYDMSLENLSSWYNSYIDHLSKTTQSSLEKYQRTASGSDLRFQNRSISNQIYQSQPIENLRAEVANFLDQNLGSRNTLYRQVAEQEIKEAYRRGPEAMKEVLHRYFDNTTYSQYTHSGMNEVKNVDVSSIMRADTQIPPLVAGRGTIRFTKSNGRFAQRGEEVGPSTILSSVRHLLEAAGYQGISLTAKDVKREPRDGVSCRILASCRQQMRNYKVMSGYQLMYDYYTRYNGSPLSRLAQFLRMQARGANTSRKITEKRLEVEMLVVGRPSLTSNGKIKISNIGSRSGDYIIETCIHQITPGEGYTCSLTLVQGAHNEPVGTVTTEVPLTSKPKKTGGGSSSAGSKRTRGDGKGGTVSTSPKEPIQIYVTPQERTYFETLLTRKDPVTAQEEFVTQIKYNREQAYAKAKREGKSEAEAREAVRRANQTGIVSTKSKHTTSDRSSLKEQLEPRYQQIPERYKVAYKDDVRAILKESVDNIKSKVKK